MLLELHLPRTSLPSEVMAPVDAATLYHQHRQKVYHLCLRLGGGNASWAEDATQDVFVRLLERLEDLAAQEDLGGWIYRVTVNTCLTRLKRDGSVWRRVRQRLAGDPPSSGDTPERRVQVRQEVRAALEELGHLPARERVIFCMKHLDSKSQQEIAATLGLSEGYVSKLLQRVRDRLERRGWEVPRA